VQSDKIVRYCLYNWLTDGSEIVSLRAARALLHRNIVWYLYVVRLGNLLGLLQSEGLRKLKELNYLIGTRTRDRPAFSMFPSPCLPPPLHLPLAPL
jgi:hypothetical protein